MNVHTVFFAALLACVATPALSASRGNADAGRDLVMTSCTSCHAPGSAAQASDAAPPLSTLASRNRANPAWVRAWLMDPHPPMPGIPLSRQQIDDVIAYLGTLQ